MTRTPLAWLFDLDGTLIDSAPDLAGAGNELRVRRGLPLMPVALLRPMVGAGARGMVGAAFGSKPGDEGYESLRDAFLEIYEGRLLNETRVFEAMESVLAALEERRLPWGIVTNKIERFTAPIVHGLGLHRRASVVICGDTTPYSKPHPAPLLEAAGRMNLAPADCVYVGDDLRDVQAGHAAGMSTIAAGWGYLGESEPIERWGADLLVREPGELLNWLPLD